MDAFLSNITQQAMNYAIRSGLTITTGFAIRECSRLLKAVKGSERDQIATLQKRLDSKIRIISPAIDMIELIAARGNTSLDSAVTLTKAIRLDIQSLGVRLAQAATDEENLARGSSRAKSEAQAKAQLKFIVEDIKNLLSRIEDAVPLINLAITTSGVNLSTALPSTVSPSRLLQASTFLTAGDSAYTVAPGRPVQVGPVFTLSLYMLFAGHTTRPNEEENVRETTWKEVLHKCRVKLLRISLDRVAKLPSDPSPLNPGPREDSPAGAGQDPHYGNVPSEGRAYEFAYQLLVIEDLNDDRVHTFEPDEEQPGVFEGVPLAGIREVIPIHQISKIFYADTGKILNIGADAETNNPILLLKRDISAMPPRRMIEDEDEGPGMDEENDRDNIQNEPAAQLRRESSALLPQSKEKTPTDADSQQWRFPPGLDPEWVAFEVFTEDPSSDEDDIDTEPEPVSSPPPSRRSREGTADPLSSAMAGMKLRDNRSPTPHSSPAPFGRSQIAQIPAPGTPETHLQPPPSTTLSPLPPLKTSLSLLELLIRLTALQQFQQSSHLSISDELLNFFLSESSTTGAGADAEYRQRVRREARRRVGFDPYDESPIKPHGEEYQRGYNGAEGGEDWEGGSRFGDEEEAGFPGSSPRLLGQQRKAGRYGARGSIGGSPFAASPSPSLRRAAQERTARGRAAAGGPVASPSLGSGVSPRVSVSAARANEKGGRDSTLGTSPTGGAER